MAEPKFLMQTLLDVEGSRFQLITKHEKDLGRDLLKVLGDYPGPIGIAPGYSKNGGLVALAIANDIRCLIVQFYSNSAQAGRGNNGRRGRGGGKKEPTSPIQRNTTGRKLVEELILCRSVGDLYAFDLGPLSMSLYCGVDLHITNGVDIQSAFSAVDRRPLSAIRAAVGDTTKVNTDNVISVFENPLYDSTNDKYCASDLAMRAWISQYLVTVGNGAETFSKVPKIDTTKFSSEMLKNLAKMTQDSLRLNHIKPLEIKHGFTAVQTAEGQGAKSTAYKNKLSKNQNVVVSAKTSQGTEINYYGTTGPVDGRTAGLNLPHTLDDSKTILSIKSIGRDDPTTAEAQRAAAILRILQGKTELLTENPWMQNIWFPAPADESGNFEPLRWPPDWSNGPSDKSAKDNLDRLNLNRSQQTAVDTMLSRTDTNRITIIQGPPGTGKTSVIAAFVKVAIEASQSGIWLVAKSNVAVINIAIKLTSAGFTDWRLLGAKDFSHADWHGHLYDGIRDRFIRSDEFRKMSASRIKGCQVILCTTAMLSNPFISKFTHQIPVTQIVVDEASQIEIGDYIPIFNRFGSTLRKMTFIGDNKQLPPFGQEDIQDLQSIFELPHLERLCLFLNTQYRMPPQIGAFISDKVYDSKLQSNPQHPIPNSLVACQFVDVEGGKEQFERNSTSSINPLEAEMVIKLAQHLQDSGKAYKIITPYDAQRVLIEDSMKTREDLIWEEKVYNVDSFQGNEEDYIIISLVRSLSLGFLQNLRRTNVMLTRCKRGMYIVSSRAFLRRGPGKDCIIGELAEHVGDLGWLTVQDVESGDFLANPRKRLEAAEGDE